MPTKNGIYYNLHESKYSITLLGIEYFFSSKFYSNKFKKNYVSNRATICGDMSSPVYNEIKKLCDCALYRSIEKRGWYVKLNGVGMSWLEIQKCVGLTVTSKPLND